MIPTRSLLGATLAALALPAAASAADVTMDPSKPADAQVDAANPGDVVIFPAGTYAGPISVADANITLRGLPGAAIVTTTGTDPAVAFAGDAGKVEDLIVLSTVGDGITYAGGANTLTRSTVVLLKAEATAASIAAGVAGDRTLAVDSSVLVSPSGTALSAARTGLLDTTTVIASHLTAIGALAATGTAQQPSFTISDSVVGGTVAAGVTQSGKNLVKPKFADVAGLFVKPAGYNFHLRADATTAIGQGSSPSAAAKDVDGDARPTGAASDLGADEFVNKAPTASLAAPAGSVRQGVPVSFDASRSSDPEATIGGGIASYHWDFGDGSTADTTTPTTSHTFGERKAYSVTVTVADKQGASSAASSPVGVTVLDGTQPVVSIGQPRIKQRINLYKKGTKKRARVTLFGNASDDTGLKSVFLALRPVASSDGQCKWFDGKSKLVTASCTAPVLLEAKVSDTSWRYVLPLKAKLPKGPYQLTAISVDTSGLAGLAKTVAFRFR
jgi:hypothetical protein